MVAVDLALIILLVASDRIDEVVLGVSLWVVENAIVVDSGVEMVFIRNHVSKKPEKCVIIIVFFDLIFTGFNQSFNLIFFKWSFNFKNMAIIEICS